ncbi:MAG: hotdog domain-containing protein [Desulfuromonadales bacterium]
MNNYAIVRQELQWVDEYAWLVASRDFPGCPLVTVGMDKISFRKPVQNGSILRFDIRHLQQGRTSVQYGVDVFADAPGANEETAVFSTIVTFAHVDRNGRKKPLPKQARLRSKGEEI